MPTALGSVIDFLQEFGFFDVILPFLLVFTIVFGILEKTKIFGVDKVGDKEYPKKGINSMIAFVIGFFVVAARQVVESIQVSLPQVVLILVLLISFMLLVGSFMGDKQFNLEGEHKGWLAFLMVVIFISVILIFLNSFGWLRFVIDYLSEATYLLVPIVLVIVVIGAILYVVGVGKSGKPEEKEEEK